MVQHCVEYLGVLFYDDLKFKNQVLFCNYTVLRTRLYLKRSQLLVYYRTHVKPIVQYGVLVYGCTAFSNLQPISRLQKRIIRNIYHLPEYTNVDQLMSENGLDTVYKLHVYELLKLIPKSKDLRTREPVVERTLRKEEGINYGRRKPPESFALIPIKRTKDGEHSLKIRVPTLFNKMNSWGVFQTRVI